jgi:hypothetical protein
MSLSRRTVFGESKNSVLSLLDVALECEDEAISQPMLCGSGRFRPSSRRVRGAECSSIYEAQSWQPAISSCGNVWEAIWEVATHPL